MDSCLVLTCFQSMLSKVQYSIVPSHPVLSMYDNNPNQDRNTNLPDSAVTRTVGGMATHWTCCCRKNLLIRSYYHVADTIPILTARPNEQEERNQSTIPRSEFDTLFDLAGRYLTVNNQLFDRYTRHIIQKDPAACRAVMSNLVFAAQIRRGMLLRIFRS